MQIKAEGVFKEEKEIRRILVIAILNYARRLAEEERAAHTDSADEGKAS